MIHPYRGKYNRNEKSTNVDFRLHTAHIGSVISAVHTTISLQSNCVLKINLIFLSIKIVPTDSLFETKVIFPSPINTQNDQIVQFETEKGWRTEQRHTEKV